MVSAYRGTSSVPSILQIHWTGTTSAVAVGTAAGAPGSAGRTLSTSTDRESLPVIPNVFVACAKSATLPSGQEPAKVSHVIDFVSR
jgi:hypothetical protein